MAVLMLAWSNTGPPGISIALRLAERFAGGDAPDGAAFGRRVGVVGVPVVLADPAAPAELCGTLDCIANTMESVPHTF